MNDVCSTLAEESSSKDTRCQALEAYAEECQEQGMQISWRSATSCGMFEWFSSPYTFDFSLAKRCGLRNQVYTECVPLCTRTCQNPTSTIVERHTQNNPCTSGCVCSSGTVYDSFQDECVRLEKCTCQYNGQSYEAGDHISMDCNYW